MNHITLLYNSPYFRRIPIAVGSGSMLSPTQEVTEWFTELGIPLKYEKLYYSAHGLQHSQSPTLRFHFEDERHALMFKLAFGGQ